MVTALLWTSALFSQDTNRSSTTFEHIYAASDLIARITIKDLRYENIDYQEDNVTVGKGLATIYEFEIIDEIKKTQPSLPNEFVSAGGKHPDGSESVWSNQAYFEIGDELLVHLTRNPKLLGSLQPYDINPRGHKGSTFAIQESKYEVNLIPYFMKKADISGKQMRSALQPTSDVISYDSPMITYDALEQLYNDLSEATTRDSK